MVVQKQGLLQVIWYIKWIQINGFFKSFYSNYIEKSNYSQLI